MVLNCLFKFSKEYFELASMEMMLELEIGVVWEYSWQDGITKQYRPKNYVYELRFLDEQRRYCI